MTGRGKKAAVPKKKANGYKMPAPIPSGEVLHDHISKKTWRIGPSIGVGGFGEIYSACEHDNSPKKGSSYPYVVKIEPHENGPLFVEKHFYIRNANKEDVSAFMKSKKLTCLGMPVYYGNGSHEFNGEKYRYLVLERYGKDVWTLFKDAGRSFSTVTVFQLGLQMLDVLEYIHSRGYVHADIKGGNILMGLKRGTEGQAYLVDFGLAGRVNDKDFKPDPKCAHNGTIEYTSRDAHLGVATMRGDLEILGYNMLQWMAGELPWERALAQPKAVQALKEDFMSHARQRITKDYPAVPDALIKFFEYINSMKPKDLPDYTKCQQLFLNYLKSEGKTRSSKIEFTPNKKTKSKRLIGDDADEKQTSNVPKVKRGRKPTATVPKNDDDDEQNSEGKKPNKKRNGVAPKVGRGRKAKPIVIESDDGNEQDAPKVGRGRIAKALAPESDDENEEPSEDENGAAPKVRRGRKPKAIIPESDAENESESEDDEPLRNNKRKSTETVLERVKKTKLTPKATPPAKKNHANTGTQTSPGTRRSPRARQVTFVSPVSGDIDPAHHSSADMFDDSFVVEEKKAKPKRKLLATEDLTVKKEVRKKTTTIEKKGKSWKDCPTIMNGRSPP